jgi:DsbC/DsbD-like thiol-disulfide interchange protein
MNSVGPKQVASASIMVLDGLQSYRPHVQVLSAAAVFLSLCENLGIPAQEAFSTTKNIINGTDGKRNEFKAVDAYIKGELM